MSDLINLATLPTRLRDLTGARPPAYDALYKKVVRGDLPAERVNGRWYVNPADLPAIASSLGLSTVSQHAA